MFEKINLGMDLADKAVTHGASLFSYMREPRSNAEGILIEALQTNHELSAKDIEAAAMQLIVRKYIRKIRNNSSIMSKAEANYKNLLDSFGNKEDVPKPTKPNNDWLEYFFEMASMVSDDVFQEIWARLLLNEHLAPGSVKKVMINTLALLDSTTAGYFTDICRLVYKLSVDGQERIVPLVLYDDNIDKLLNGYKGDASPFEKYKELCHDEDELELLAEVGLLTTTNLLSSTYKIYFPEDSKATFACEGLCRTVNGSYNEEDDVYEVQTGFVFFTQIGLALYRTLHIDPFDGLATVLDRYIDNQLVE